MSANRTARPTHPHTESDSAWIIPFSMVLMAALAFFIWEMAQYTRLLG